MLTPSTQLTFLLLFYKAQFFQTVIEFLMKDDDLFFSFLAHNCDVLSI